MAAHPVPQPPFSEDLLADLHAGNVPPELSEDLWPRVRKDPEATLYLRLLDEVDGGLRCLGADPRIISPMPPQVAVRFDRLLDDLAEGKVPESAEPSATILPLRASVPGRSAAAPARPPARRPWLVAAAAAVVVLACGAALIGVLRGRDVAPTALPSPSTRVTTPVRDSDLSTTALLDALGRNDISGPLAGPGALTACLAAAGRDHDVLGTMNITYHGAPAVLILLTGPEPPKISALVVAPGCGPGDPQILETRDIG